MKKLYLLVLLILAGSFLHAQFRVRGVVSDQADGSPLIGVTVREKGANNGAATDLDGRFTLTVAGPNAVLIFTYTGYVDKEINLAGREQLEVVLGAGENLLEQVVVVGYGTQKKSDLTGSVGSVKTEDIERIPTGSLEQALQGKIAGVYVTPSSGEPGAGAVIRIRGTGTLNNSNPIYVVDGMITYDASFVNPQDVQSVEVLKDASAAAIYGARGANGVVIITTKNGKQRAGDAVVTLNSYYGSQSVTKKLDLANAAEFAQLYNELTNSNFYPDPASLGEGTDWQDEIFRPAPIGSVQVAANGGTDRFSYNFSGNYFNQTGIIENSEFKRYTVRFNSEAKLNSWLRLGNNLAYANSFNQFEPGVVGSAYRMPPVFAAKDANGNFTDPTSPFGLAIANPAADLFYKKDRTRRADRFFGTVYGDVQFLKHFTFRSNFGFDLDFQRGRSFTPIFQVSASQLNKEDNLSQSSFQKRDWIWEQTLTYNREWTNHRLTVLAGYTAEERYFEEIGAGRRSFPGTSDEVLYLDLGNDTTQTNYGRAGDEALISYLFRTNYTLFDRYLFTASARVDQASRFTKDNRTAVFPSFSLGWNAGQESFIENLGLFDRLKLRVSWGLLGNQNSALRYPSLGLVGYGLYSIFGPDENLNQGAALIQLGNPNLLWETTRQTDIGLELGLFNNRFTAEVDWYHRYTYDIISQIRIPDYVGFNSDPIINSGAMINRGWDITLNWRQAGEFTWNVGAILSPVHNELEKINEQRKEILAAFLQGEPASRTTVGNPVGAFYGYKVAGVFQNQEQLNTLPRLGNEGVGDLRYEDLNGDGKVDGEDRTYLGSPIPTLTYGLNAGFNWKGLDFAIDFFGARGNMIFNAKKTFRFSVYNWEKSFYDGHWTPENPNATKPRITNGGSNYRVSDYYLEDGSFFRLRTVVLGYSLPKNWLRTAKIDRFRVYLSGFNIWTSQKYSGYSPEFPNRDNVFETGFDFGAYPVTQSWQFGLDVTF